MNSNSTTNPQNRLKKSDTKVLVLPGHQSSNSNGQQISTQQLINGNSSGTPNNRHDNAFVSKSILNTISVSSGGKSSQHRAIAGKFNKSRDHLNSTLGVGKTSQVGMTNHTTNFQIGQAHQLNSAQKVGNKHTNLKSPLRRSDQGTSGQTKSTSLKQQSFKFGNLGSSSQAHIPASNSNALESKFKSNVSNSSQSSNNNVGTGLRNSKGGLGNKQGSITNRGNKKDSILRTSQQENFISASNVVNSNRTTMLTKTNRNTAPAANNMSSRERLLGPNNNAMSNQRSIGGFVIPDRKTIDSIRGNNHSKTEGMHNNVPLNKDIIQRVNSSDPQASPRQQLMAIRQKSNNSGALFLQAQTSSGGAANVKSSTFSGSALQKMKMSPKSSLIPQNNLFQQKHMSQNFKQDTMEIEDLEFSPLAPDKAKFSLESLLLNLISFDKARKMEGNGILNYSLKDLGTAVDDQKILDCPLDLRNQKTIHDDANRTRILHLKKVWKPQPGQTEDELRDEIVGVLEKILTFYTKNSNTVYKQGYNEILGPFLWLTVQDMKGRSQDPFFRKNRLTLAFHAMNLFVKNMMPTLYLDDDGEFFSLPSCFFLLRLLLKYHDPEICQFLSSAYVSPEMYATRWFFSYFASKQDQISVVLELWKEMIAMKDNKMIFFVSLALILNNRDEIIHSNKSDLPIVMSELFFNSEGDVQDVLQLALKLKSMTPVSFYNLEETKILFGDNSEQLYRKMSNENKMQLNLQLAHMQCLPVELSELMNNIYPNIVPCKSPGCLNALYKPESSQISSQVEYIFSERINQVVNSPSFNGVLIGGNLQAQMQELDDFRTSKGMRVNNMIFSPSKIQKGPSVMIGANQHRGAIQGILGSPNEKDLKHKSLFENQFKLNTLNSGNKSPFKTMVKQQPIEADASVVQMETETNVKDDEEEPVQNKVTTLYEILNEKIKFMQKQTDKNEFESQEICEACRGKGQYQINRNSDVSSSSEKIRLIIIDCRIQQLQQELMLPSTCKLSLVNNIDRFSLTRQIQQFLSGCSEEDHICLLGLQPSEIPKDFTEATELGLGLTPTTPSQKRFESRGSIEEFHEKVFKAIVEIFYQEKAKYVSFLPGGFLECHRFVEKVNLVQLRKMCHQNLTEPFFLRFLDPHDSQNCYHCVSGSEAETKSTFQLSRPSESSLFRNRTTTYDHLEGVGSPYQMVDDFTTQGDQTRRDPFIYTNSYSQNIYSLDMSTPVKEESKQSQLEQQSFDIFSGFRSWWQDNVTNNQKLIRGFGGHSEIEQNETSVRLQNVTEITRNNLMSKRKDSNNMGLNNQESIPEVGQYGVPSMIISKKQNHQSKSFAQSPGIHNHSGFNFGQKKSMTIDESLQVMGQQKQEKFESNFYKAGEDTSGNSRIGLIKSFSRERSSTSKPKILALNDNHNFENKSLNKHDFQDQTRKFSGAQGKGYPQQYYQISQSDTLKSLFNENQTRINAQKQIASEVSASELTPSIAGRHTSTIHKNPQSIGHTQEDEENSESIQNRSSQVSGSEPKKQKEETKSSKIQDKVVIYSEDIEGSVGGLRSKMSDKESKKSVASSQQFLLEERSYYLCNGIQTIQGYSSYLPKVQQIIEVDCPAQPEDIVIYHVKRLASSHLQQLIQQRQWSQPGDTPDEEVKPVTFGREITSAQITTLVITQFTTICLCQVNHTIQSRFFMHDLIKITSRKSSAKIITFYFRIPQFGEYNTNFYADLEQERPIPDNQQVEHAILSGYNRNPLIPYQFAYKRKKFQEVKMGFEFTTEEEAKDCIERVSILYKRLKESRSSTRGEQNAN